MILDPSSGSAAGQLRSIVERIERLDEEIKALNDDKSDVYQEAKFNGYDVKVIRKIVADRRKGLSVVEEFEAVEATYRAALGMIAAPRVRVHAREEAPPLDPETGEIIEDQTATALAAPTAPSGRAADESSDAIYHREPLVDAGPAGGETSEARCGEGSQPHLPSDRAENKPDAPAVIAGEPIRAESREAVEDCGIAAASEAHAGERPGGATAPITLADAKLISRITETKRRGLNTTEAGDSARWQRLVATGALVVSGGRLFNASLVRTVS